jgi:Lipase (class 3)
MLRNLACLDPLPENLFFPPKRGDYIYFESPHCASGVSHLVDAAWAADAAMFAYARYGSTRMQEEEFTNILRSAGFSTVEIFGDCFVDNARTARGFFASNDDRALLAFRGTEKDNAHDVEADADILLIDDSGVRIHQGFHQYLQMVWWRVAQVLRSYRNDHPTQDICITGHSLGAALATLSFLYLNDPATSLFTFGCPRVGDRAFCDRITAAARHPCYRIVDNQDVVTHVPLHTLGSGYDHPAIPMLWLDPNGHLVENPPDPPGDWADFAHVASGFVNGHLLELLPKELPRPLADHSPVRYCHWVGQAAAAPASGGAVASAID